MADSERAALAARRAGLPVGLHLNLTEPFTDPSTPRDVLDLQVRVARRLHGKSRLRRWVFDPFVHEDVERCVAYQLAAFETLHGRVPTHVDGHQHVHVYPNVATARALAPGTKVRNVLWRYPVKKSLGALARGLRQRTLGRRFVSTDYFVDISEVDPRTKPGLRLAANASVEVMCHPGFADERERLMADEWAQALRQYRLGSYADLGRAGDERPSVRAFASSARS